MWADTDAHALLCVAKDFYNRAPVVRREPQVAREKRVHVRPAREPRFRELLPGLKLHVNVHRHLDGHTVQECLVELPLTDRGNRRALELGAV